MTTKEIDDAAWFKYPFTYRNNRGVAKTKKGFIRFGMPPPPAGKQKDTLKGGDRIGFTPVVVTPDMIGKKISIFTNIEIKGPGDKLVQGQIDWHNFVLNHGGISEIWYEDKVERGIIE